MRLQFPAADVEIHDPAPLTTRLAPLTSYHLDGIRTALLLGLSGEVPADLALRHAAEQLEKLSAQLAGGACYGVEPVVPVRTPADEVAAGIASLLDDTAALANADRDHRGPEAA